MLTVIGCIVSGCLIVEPEKRIFCYTGFECFYLQHFAAKYLTVNFEVIFVEISKIVNFAVLHFNFEHLKCAIRAFTHLCKSIFLSLNNCTHTIPPVSGMVNHASQF